MIKHIAIIKKHATKPVYLCNQAVYANKENIAVRCEIVTCKNCLKAVKKYLNSRNRFKKQTGARLVSKEDITECANEVTYKMCYDCPHSDSFYGKDKNGPYLLVQCRITGNSRKVVNCPFPL